MIYILKQLLLTRFSEIEGIDVVLPTSIVGVFLNASEVEKGIEHWMRENPNEALYFEKWLADTFEEANGMGWSYIPRNANIDYLRLLCDSVPVRSAWGKNLGLQTGCQIEEYGVVISG